MKKIVEMWNRVSLIAKILVGIVIGAVLGLLVPGATGIGLIGSMMNAGVNDTPFRNSSFILSIVTHPFLSFLPNSIASLNHNQHSI